MSPVHVIVGEDVRAEQMWSSAFTGAVDLYRFERNVDAFERLTAAQAPIDLVVLTPAQRGPFNLTPDQFVARVLEGPLGASSTLANLHVIVVGSPLTRSHPRAMSVSTLDAAIRLVKFGEVETAPRPQSVPLPAATPVAPAPRADHPLEDIVGDEFSGSIISRIWNAVGGDADENSGSDDFDVLGGGAAAAPAAAQSPQQAELPPMAHPVQSATPAGPAALFSRAAPAGFVAAAGQAPHAQAQPQAPAQAPVHGGGAQPMPMQVGAPGESIEVATGVLQPARPYQLEGGGSYRGPATRGGVPHMASHDAAGGQPVPPALASQVQSMVYGGSVQVGNPHDPLMVWSSGARAAGDAQSAAPSVAPMQSMPQQQVMPPHGAQPVPPRQPQVRTVPMDPPAGVYGGAPAPVQSQAAQADPFLARAEAAGGDVAFG